MIIQNDDELLVQIGFHLQQYVEKRMKACLQKHNIDYPKTHDLSILLELFPQEKIIENDEVFAHILSRYAVESRYGRYTGSPFDGQQMSDKAKDLVRKIETLWDAR